MATRKEREEDEFRAERFLLMLLVAAFTSALWRYILGVPPFEELWWAHAAPVGAVRPGWYELAVTGASCLAWGLLGPFLYRNKPWSILPVAAAAPFLWAVLVSLGLLLTAGFGHLGFSAALVGLFRQGLAAFLFWAFSPEAARVLFPVALATGVLAWLALNKFDPGIFLGRPPATARR